MDRPHDVGRGLLPPEAARPRDRLEPRHVREVPEADRQQQALHDSQREGSAAWKGKRDRLGRKLYETAVVRGFTVTNGYTRGVLTDGKTSHGSYITMGFAFAGDGYADIGQMKSMGGTLLIVR